MSDAQGSKSIEERVSFLENRLRDLESRLSALEGPRQNDAKAQQIAPSTAAEKKESKKSPISVTLLSKKFEAGDVGDRIGFVLLFKSGLEKDVRAFKGTLAIRDLFDQDLMRVSLTQETGISAGGTSEWKGGIEYNQYSAPHQRLLAIDIKDTSVFFNLEQIIYTDGARESFA